jgi:2-methylaconitate cis-trans-isomerase PrpF
LPTGNRPNIADIPGVGSVEYSVVDIAGLQVFVTAKDFGLDCTEGPLEIQNMHDVCTRLDYLRRKAAVDLGFATSIDTAGDESPVTPFTIPVAPPADWQLYSTDERRAADICDLLARCGVGGFVHKAFPGTGAIPVGVAAGLQGTVVHDIARPPAHATRTYRIGHPGGTMTVGVGLAESRADVTVVRAGLTRTAGRIFAGTVFAELSRVPGLSRH